MNKKILNLILTIFLLGSSSPIVANAEEIPAESQTEETNVSETNNMPEANETTSGQVGQDENETEENKNNETENKSNETTDDTGENTNNQTKENENNNEQQVTEEPVSEETEEAEAAEEPEESKDSVQSENSANVIQNNNSYQIEVNPEEVKTKTNQYFPVLNEAEVISRSNNGESLIVLSGNMDDNAFTDMVNGYIDIYERIDNQELKNSIFFLDDESINDDDTNKLIELSNENDREKLRKGIDELKNSSSGNGVAFYVFNQRIIKVSSIADGNYGYSWFDIAHYDIQAYQPSIGKTGMNTESNNGIAGVLSKKKSMAQSNTPETGYEDEITTPPATEGEEWHYGGRDTIQEFTAPVTGTYKIQIWGADGDTDTAYPRTYSAGVGGQGGYTYGYMDLQAGQKLYLAMGLRNNFRNGPSYNGGGAGYGQNRAFLAGGGGAASVYLTSIGNGELTNYSNNRDEILMVAGGGGGAEDWFTGWPRYCAGLPGCLGSVYSGNGSFEQRTQSGATSYGGNGGGLSGTAGNSMSTNTFEKHSGGPGANTVDGQKISGYLFGVGEDYSAGDNASAGAGGGGYYGGLSYHSNAGDASNLYGGAGGGGSGYYNTKYIRDGHTEQGKGLTFEGININKYPGTDNGQNARGIITLETIKSYTLTINYLDLNETNCTGTDCVVDNGVSYKKVNTTEAPTVVKTLKFGADYKESVPKVTGYSVQYITYQGDVENGIPTFIEGKMPQHDVVINVFYDYSKLTVTYVDYETNKELMPKFETRIKTGGNYCSGKLQKDSANYCNGENVVSPHVDGYIIDIGNYDNINKGHKNLKVGETSSLSGVKQPYDENYVIYYVPIIKPYKDVIEKNGINISKEDSDKGIQVKADDEYTYKITWENKVHAEREIIITDTLDSKIELINGTISNNGTYDANTRTITWHINAPARTSARGEEGKTGFVTFRVKVHGDATQGTIPNRPKSNDCSVNGTDVVDCDPRHERIVSYTVVKSSDPESGSEVATDSIITYNLTVQNTSVCEAGYEDECILRNVLVADQIPVVENDIKNIEFIGITTSYPGIEGRANQINRYVSYIIPTLSANGNVVLGFKIRVKYQANETNPNDRKKIINYAMYDQLGTLPSDNAKQLKDSEVILEKGKKTNETIHYITGPKVEVTKSSEPVSESLVKDGDIITYHVTAQNTGTVPTHWIRLDDKIPEGTTYVPGSLKMESENILSNESYSYFVDPGNFTTHYDFRNNRYVISEINSSGLSNGFNQIKVTYPAGYAFKATVPSGWYELSRDSTSTTYATNSSNNLTDFVSFAGSVTLSGEYASNGAVGFELIYSAPAKFDVSAEMTTGYGRASKTVAYGSMSVHARGSSAQNKAAGEFGEDHYAGYVYEIIVNGTGGTYSGSFAGHGAGTVNGYLDGWGSCEVNGRAGSYKNCSVNITYRTETQVASGKYLYALKRYNTEETQPVAMLKVTWPSGVSVATEPGLPGGWNRSTSGNTITYTMASASPAQVNSFMNQFVFRGEQNQQGNVTVETLRANTTTNYTTPSENIFTVDRTGYYTIIATGGQGGSGGAAPTAAIQENVRLTAGEQLIVGVGSGGAPGQDKQMHLDNFTYAATTPGYSNNTTHTVGAGVYKVHIHNGDGSPKNYINGHEACGGQEYCDMQVTPGQRIKLSYTADGGGHFVSVSDWIVTPGTETFNITDVKNPIKADAAYKNGYDSNSLTVTGDGIHFNWYYTNGQAKINGIDMSTFCRQHGDGMYDIPWNHQCQVKLATGTRLTIEATGGDILSAYQGVWRYGGSMGGSSTVRLPDGRVITGNGTSGAMNNNNYGANGSVTIKLTRTDPEDEGLSSGFNTKNKTGHLASGANSAGCKYVTSNGAPYVECLTKDLVNKGGKDFNGVTLDRGQMATMTFQVKVNDGESAKRKEIDNVALYETRYDVPSGNENKAGTITTLPTEKTNTTVHYLENPSNPPTIPANPKINIVKTAVPNYCDDADANRKNKGSCRIDVNQIIIYNLTITNTGNATQKYLQVRDALPANTTFINANKNGVKSSGASGLPNDQNNGYVEWVLDNIEPNASIKLMFTVRVNESISSGTEIRNRAYYKGYVDYPGGPGTITTIPDTPTNEVYHVVLRPENMHVSVTKSANPDSGTTATRSDFVTLNRQQDLNVPTEIEYTIRVANKGKYEVGSKDATIRHMLVKDEIPDGTTFIPDASYSLDGVKHSTTDSENFNVKAIYTSANGNNKAYVVWLIDWLACEDYVDLSFKVGINKETDLDKLNNTAYYIVGDKVYENPDGTVTVPPRLTPTNTITHLLNKPHIKVNKKANPTTGETLETAHVVARTQTIEYTLTVLNDSTEYVNYAYIEDTVPTYTSYIKDSITVSSGRDKAGVVPGDNSTKLQWKLYDMAPNETRTLTFRVMVDVDAPQGKGIINKAQYGISYSDTGKEPGTPDFTVPTPTNTNQTVHVVELEKDIIDAGGEGWNSTQFMLGVSLLTISAACIFLFRKKSKK